MATERGTVLITGCTKGGLGDELARQYHAKEFRVFATSRKLESMEGLRDLGIETFTLDVTNAGNIAQLRKQIEELTGGTLNILVNNAGIPSYGAAADYSMDEVRNVFETNVFGPMMMVKEFLPLLVASRNGYIVNIGSLAGIAPLPFASDYGAAKAALHSYTDTLRIEVAPLGVKVILVAMGMFKSNIGEGRSHTLPESSVYKTLEAEFHAPHRAIFPKLAWERESVVAPIVAETEKVTPRAWLWTGFMSWNVWFANTFYSRTASDSRMSKVYGLTQLGERLRKKGRVA